MNYQGQTHLSSASRPDYPQFLSKFEKLCDVCEGRGWVWAQAYDYCPDCMGTGVWESWGTDRTLMHSSKKSHPVA